MLRRKVRALRALVLWSAACANAAVARPMPGDSLYLADVLARVAVSDESIAVQKTREEQVRAQVLSAAAFLDPTLRLEAEANRSRPPVAGSAAAAVWATTYSASVVQGTPWGVTVAPYATRSAAPAWTGVPSSVGLDLSIPLLRLGFRNPSGALLRAAQLRLVASARQTRHVQAEALHAAAHAYWEFRAGHDRLAILQRAERRAWDVVEVIGRLVEAGERAAADRTQAEAFAADRMRERSGAEQQLRVHAARLAALTSRPLDDMLRVVPAREMPRSAVEATSDRAAALETRLDDRDDVVALRTQLGADRLLARSHSVDLLPDLRVSARVGHAYSTSAGPWDGHFLSLSVTLLGNMYNRRARSSLMRQRAVEREQRLAYEHGLRRARISLAIAEAAVQNARLELAAARAALSAHEQAVRNVRQTLEAGIATLFDVILAEDRLTNARLAVVGAEARLGQAVARRAVERGDVSVDREEVPADWAARLLGAGPRQ